MSALDPRIEAIRKKYSLEASDFWELPQKKGCWLAKHSALEAVAVQAKVDFEPPQVLEANSADKIVALCISGSIIDNAAIPPVARREWSIGEAAPANNKNSYPYAMAEKRGKDRVILKLVGLHGLVYSEEEMDNSNSAAAPKQAQPAAPSRNLMDPRENIAEWAIDYCAQQKIHLSNCTTVAEIQDWVENQEGDLKELKKHALDKWADLRKFKENRIGNINLEGVAAE
jgi:hypothetical protein